MVNRGVGYDQELLPWLETYTFPVEARYGDADFAEAAWKRFLNRMWANGTPALFRLCHHPQGRPPGG